VNDPIDVRAAWAAIESALAPLGDETVPLADARGRVLCTAVRVDRDLPPFDRAAMDGFAVDAATTRTARRDAPVVVDVVGESTPGAPFTAPVGAARAVRIMTGAPVPAGCDAVVPVEQTSGFDATPVELYAEVDAGRNVTRRGSERRAGDEAFVPGHRLRAADVGALAMIGVADVHVGRRARVAVLSTGNELVPHATRPGPAAIRDSNSPLLAALAAPWSAAVHVVGIAADDRAELAARIESGLAFDVLLVTGGVSMGAYDHVADVLAAAGVRMHFHGVALQPGKPTGFGTHRHGAVLALPGNPVSALTTFRLFATVALGRLEGAAEPRPELRPHPARFTWQRRNPKWVILPGRSFPDGVRPVPYGGSGDLLAYARADCQIVLPPEVEAVRPGDPVATWPLGDER
jgi:molybdenum cofactor synthesis domain-containing protein